MKKFICIHGHFYQPPRENPWIDVIERQESAYPYHDWNQRIDAECYTPNTAARLLDAEQYIVDVLNNYEYISFNFGPTLMQWIERFSPKTYQRIIEADTISVHRNNGHGNAIAQVYNHIIMPLANRTDKQIQVKWAIEDFRYHFHRDPEGMWLAETAVDIETLEVLADYGIKFTILSPYQAKRFRVLGTKTWIDVAGAIDGRYPYLCKLPGGKSIIIFFYDGIIAQEVAFGGLLNNGEMFFRRLLEAANAPTPFKNALAVLENIATDGETYGHHHKFAEMGLAYAIKRILESKDVEITNYAAFLDQFPPFLEVEIRENTSWSCAHGIERWRDNCGCKVNAGSGNWNQKWRKPLRKAMEFLRQTTQDVFYEKAIQYTDKPDDLLLDYIDVLLRPHLKQDWLYEHIKVEHLTEKQKVLLWSLLEACKFSLYIFTSCAWFFDEISGIETVQVLTYAVRCIELLKELGIEDVEERFLEILAEAKSNIEEFKDGRWIYLNMAKSRRICPKEIGVHFAICSLFSPIDENPYRLYCYSIENEEFYRDSFNDYQILLGRLQVKFLPTEQEQVYEYAVLYTGAHDVRCSLKEGFDDIKFNQLIENIASAFKDHNLTELVRAMDDYFGRLYYNMNSVLSDQRQKILDQIVSDTLIHFEETFESLFEAYQMFFQGLRQLHYCLPSGLMVVVQQVLNRKLKLLLAKRNLDTDVYQQILSVLEEIELYGVSIDVGEVKESLELILSDLITSLKRSLDRTTVSALLRLTDILMRIRIQINLWELQNIVIEYNKNHKDRILPDILVLWKELGQRIGVRL